MAWAAEASKSINRIINTKANEKYLILLIRLAIDSLDSPRTIRPIFFIITNYNFVFFIHVIFIFIFFLILILPASRPPRPARSGKLADANESLPIDASRIAAGREWSVDQTRLRRCASQRFIYKR